MTLPAWLERASPGHLDLFLGRTASSRKRGIFIRHLCLSNPEAFADARSLAAVHVASQQSAYREVLPAEFLSTLSVDLKTEGWRTLLAREAGSVLVATTGAGRLVGFCHVGPNRAEPRRFGGEVHAIYLLEEMRRRGLGRELFARGADSLRSAGLESFLVWVLALNAGARRFYERLGGAMVAERPIEIGGGSYVEVAYGWASGAIGGPRVVKELR